MPGEDSYEEGNIIAYTYEISTKEQHGGKGKT